VTLTKADRDRTVLLLRCAAEVAVTGEYVLGPGWVVALRLQFSEVVRKRVCKLATRAAQYGARSTSRDHEGASNLDEYLAVVLKAALCAEEGSWPR
jgi:hypothetical protein